jgi:hypothetical protein
MSNGNRSGEPLESWKQIAAHLKRSERTVRRWEASEGLPVHRRRHEKQDTVFAYTQEIEHWSRRRTRQVTADLPAANSGSDSFPVTEVPSSNRPSANRYLSEHDRITHTIQKYIAGARSGRSDLMRSAFHPDATLAGYCLGIEYTGSIETLFRWIDENGPAPKLETRFARMEVFETIAVVHLETQRWSGKLAGQDRPKR